MENNNNRMDECETDIELSYVAKTVVRKSGVTMA